MRKAPVIFALTCALLSIAHSAEPEYHRPPGMPEGVLIAFDDYQSDKKALSNPALFSLSQFRWMLQVPPDSRSVSMVLEIIDQSTDQTRELGRFSFDPVPPDPGKRTSRPTYFPIILTLMPDATFTDDPWNESSKCLVLAEIPDLAIVIRRTVTNPFQKKATPISFFYTSRIATPFPMKPGMWDGFGTAFNIMASGEADSRTLRVRFEATAQIK